LFILKIIHLKSLKMDNRRIKGPTNGRTKNKFNIANVGGLPWFALGYAENKAAHAHALTANFTSNKKLCVLVDALRDAGFDTLVYAPTQENFELWETKFDRECCVAYGLTNKGKPMYVMFADTDANPRYSIPPLWVMDEIAYKTFRDFNKISDSLHISKSIPVGEIMHTLQNQI